MTSENHVPGCPCAYCQGIRESVRGQPPSKDVSTVKVWTSRYSAGTESYRSLVEANDEATDEGTRYVLESDHRSEIERLTRERNEAISQRNRCATGGRTCWQEERDRLRAALERIATHREGGISQGIAREALAGCSAEPGGDERAQLHGALVRVVLEAQGCPPDCSLEFHQWALASVITIASDALKRTATKTK